jgi:uncharacterized protein (DUF2336 family)
MYFVVGAELRRRIISRNASIDPDLLETVLTFGVAKLATEDGVWPQDYLESLTQIKNTKSGARLSPTEVARILRSGNRTAFCIALAEMADVDFFTVSRVIGLAEVDGLAVLCKAAGFDGPLFLTIAVSIIGGSNDGMGKARSYSLHYAELPQDAALRTVRFWRLRRGRREQASPVR